MAELKKGRKVKSTLKMYPQGTLQLILQYFTSSAAASEPRTAMASSGVFGVQLSTVTTYVYHCALISVCHCTLISVCHCALISVCHCALISVCHCVLISVCHCTLISVCHCALISVCHCTLIIVDH